MPKRRWDYFVCGCRFMGGERCVDPIWEPCKTHLAAERLLDAARLMNAQLDMDTPDRWNEACQKLKDACPKMRKAKS